MAAALSIRPACKEACAQLRYCTELRIRSSFALLDSCLHNEGCHACASDAILIGSDSSETPAQTWLDLECECLM